MSDIIKGSLVRADAGRDNGSYFVILSSQDEYVYLSDGKRRKVEKPKKKKLRHISPTGYTDGFLSHKLSSGENVTNKEVKRAISNYLNRNDNN